MADDLAHAARTRDWGWGRDEHDPAVWLSLASMELCLARRPEVVVWENVPQVAPLYDALEKVYAEEGYSVDQWVLDAETFGIPQTRQRRFLVARANYFVPNAPEPTHRRWVHPRYEARRAEADAIDAAAGRRPWVSMGEALGVDSDVVALNTGRRWKKGGTRDDAQTTPLTEPSPTVSTLTCSQWQWRLRRHAGGDAWDWPSPITTRDSRGCSVSIAEAARLQTFPDNHPWVGSKAEVTMQIGNAVPPALAGFVAAHAASLPTEPVEDYLDVLLGTPIPQEVSA